MDHPAKIKEIIRDFRVIQKQIASDINMSLEIKRSKNKEIERSIDELLSAYDGWRKFKERSNVLHVSYSVYHLPAGNYTQKD